MNETLLDVEPDMQISKEDGTVELSNEQLGEMFLNKKPIFSSETDAEVVDITVRVRDELKEDRNGNKRKEGYLRVTMTTPKGEVLENLGGVHVYEEERGPVISFGKMSYSGKLERMVKETFGPDSYNNVNEMLELVKGKKVVIKTEETTYPTKEGTKKNYKAIIQRILK